MSTYFKLFTAFLPFVVLFMVGYAEWFNFEDRHMIWSTALVLQFWMGLLTLIILGKI